MKVVRYRTKIPIYRSKCKWEKWLNKCRIIFERQGLPSNYIIKVFKMKLEYSIHRQEFVIPTAGFLEHVQRMLEELSIVRSADHWCMSRCEVITRLDQGEPSMNITLWVDENDPRNQKVNFDELPVVAEIESDSFTPLKLNNVARKLLL